MNCLAAILIASFGLALSVLVTNFTVVELFDKAFSDGGRINGSDYLDIARLKNNTDQNLSIVMC